jgi:NAD(P)-dependent dehydrogenase (short-subunit alcohol dehydrogenase family)
MNTTTHDRPVVLVSGASRGLGAVMSRRLAAEGFSVFAGVRSPSPAPAPDRSSLWRLTSPTPPAPPRRAHSSIENSAAGGCSPS